MTVPPPIAPQARAEAAVWLARLCADDRNAGDERAFQAWLLADPANAAAFEAVNNMWDSIGGVAHDLRGMNMGPGARRHALPDGMDRRVLLGGLALLAVAGGSFTFLRRAEARTYETDIGEQKHVILDDGTSVFLDTNTRAVVDFSAGNRRVDLHHGRANFRVARAGGRLFTVAAAERLVIGAHPTFDVRCSGDRMSVILIRGQAMVESAGDAATGEKLSTGERLIAVKGEPVRRDRPNLVPLLAWQTGQAIFENDTLQHAVAEMNRYSTDRIRIADPRIADLRLSGVYRVGDNVAFARTLAMLLPVTLRETRNGIQLVGDSSRIPRG